MILTKERLDNDEKFLNNIKKILTSRFYKYTISISTILMIIRLPRIYFENTTLFVMVYPIVQWIFIICLTIVVNYLPLAYLHKLDVKKYNERLQHEN